MKKMMMAVLALSAFATEARYINDADASWSLEELQRPGLMIQAKNNPKIVGIPNSGVSGLGKTVYMNITDLCLENGTVFSKEEVKVCVARDYVYDRDGERSEDKVCVETDFAILSAPVQYKKEVCATRRDAAGRAYYLQHGELDTDYPNCSVFKEIDMTKKTTWKFNIVKKVSKSSPNYQNRYKGQFLFTKTFTLPACQ